MNELNELMTRESGPVDRLLEKLERQLAEVGRLTENYRPVLGGERYLTDREVAQLLKTSRRTLQEHRDAGRMAYIQLGGKILYRESDIERMLREGYREAFHHGD